jgi:hypothetical protein
VPQNPSVQLASAPIVNSVIPPMAALLVSWDFNKPSQPVRRDGRGWDGASTEHFRKNALIGD